MSTLPSILVIDDMDGIRDMLRDGLKAAGYRVSLAAGGRQGLELFAETPADLVITDIFMADCDGLEVIRLLRNRHPALPIIAISGDARLPHQKLLPIAKALGANQILIKPFHLRELIAVVRMLLPAAGVQSEPPRADGTPAAG